MALLNIVSVFQNNRSLAFHYRNFNWFLFGSFISRTGEWFDRVAINWYIFTLTNSPFYIGLLEFSRLIPVLFFSFLGGMAADKWDRRRVLLFIQVGSMFSTFVLAYVLYKGTITVDNFYYLAIIIAIRGIFLAFEIPTRNALVANLVPKQALASGLSFYSATLNTSRIIGPAIAGVLLGIWSAPLLILINAFSFFAVIITLLLITTEASMKKNEDCQPYSESFTFKEGFVDMIRYLKGNRVVYGIFLLGIVPMIFGYPYITLMPVFAKEVLEAGSQEFGMLLSAAATGAVFSSLILGWGKYPFNKGKILFLCVVAFGLGLMLFSLSQFLGLSILLMLFIGAMSQGYRVTHRVIIQEIIPDRLRGRVLSIMTMDTGMLPIGSLMIGLLAQYYGARISLFVMGGICILSAVIVVLRNREILSMR